MLHQIRGDAGERPADVPIARDPAAADRIDDAAGGVGAVLDRQPQLDLDRRVTEAAALHAEEADLVVALPGDVVARTDVDVGPGERLGENALHGGRLRAPL